MSLWDLNRKPRLLVVQNDVEVSKLLRIYFEGLGADVLLAVKGREAIALCSTQLIDLVILDYMLPDMDGVEILRQIRLLNKYVSVYFLTAKNEPSDVLQGLELGADDYISMPFDIEELRLRVENGLKHRSIYLKYMAKNETGEFSKHVFISYSQKDSAYAHKLAQAIENHELPVWIDERIDHGTGWPDVIQEKIDSCKVFILIMSEGARESEWVKHELAYAQDKGKRIYPLLLGGDVWLSVASLPYVNLRNRRLPEESFFNDLIEDIR